MLRITVLLAGAIALFFAVPASAEMIPAGTKIEIRLSTPVGSRVSHIGDRVEATVIAPVVTTGPLVSLNGATVSGEVEDVEALGLGFKRGFAQLRFRFTSMELPDGLRIAIDGRVHAIETARERVGNEGEIEGIDAAANLSSGASFVISTALIHSELFAPAIAVKFLAVRSPDSEIYFPVGTELVLDLANDLDIDSAGTAAMPPALSPHDANEAANLLARLPGQQTTIGGTHSSDLVNVLLLGDNDEIHSAFRAAGWTGENRHSVLALYRIYHCLVQRMGYSMAPMSKLTLNGLAPTRAYQKSLDTFAKRHHVRLWNQPQSDAWLGAGSEDVGYTIRRMHLTHAIAPEIDDERAKIVNDLWFTGCIQSASLLPRTSLKFAGEKGYVIATDGDIAVLRMNSCEHPRTVLKSDPVAHQPSRLVRAFSAVALDLARANPATVGLVAFRSIASLKHHNPPGTIAAAWRRPSFIDPPADKPRKEMVAGYIPGHNYSHNAASGFFSSKSANH